MFFKRLFSCLGDESGSCLVEYAALLGGRGLDRRRADRRSGGADHRSAGRRCLDGDLEILGPPGDVRGVGKLVFQNSDKCRAVRLTETMIVQAKACIS